MNEEERKKVEMAAEQHWLCCFRCEEHFYSGSAQTARMQLVHIHDGFMLVAPIWPRKVQQTCAIFGKRTSDIDESAEENIRLGRGETEIGIG